VPPRPGRFGKQGEARFISANDESVLGWRTIAEELAIPVSVQYSNLLRDGEPAQPQNGSGETESGELILCPYFWEYQRYSPEFGYQDQIPSLSGYFESTCLIFCSPRFPVNAIVSG
jgi:hypothetical protein